jgi:uncharacterized protein with GYD domain
MIFITLGKFRKKPTKEGIAATSKLLSQAQKEGVKVLGFYWTLGRYDSVLITEGPDKHAIENVMQGNMATSETVATETLVALEREDAIKLLD